MAEWQYYRNYEVSVWTLQDSYITTLKSGDPILIASSSAAVWPQARARGQIQNGEMNLNIDGTQTLTFDIPMYLFKNGKRVENPNWYNTINKNILTSMKKIKVIFDKWNNLNNQTAMSNSTFEFIILKVTETHEQDNLICHVECEGLAFHELGKVGYKRSLTAEEYYDDYYKWSIATIRPTTSAAIDQLIDYDYPTQAAWQNAKPINNLQYWMKKAKIEPVPKSGSAWDLDNINPTEWYYDIQMAHTALVHEQTVNSNKIYEEGYPVDWTTERVPMRYVETREMTRLVDINESNLYNITQDLAEKFNVFCRYQYLYDSNYNIIGRIIVFYNNFLQEDKDVITLMYPNSASRIMREMDSTDVSTKMFVRSVDSDELYTGIVSLLDCEANPTREDYLMNFDYLYETGVITKEQFEAIKPYEKSMRQWNDKIFPLQDAVNQLSDQIADIDAKVKVLTESIGLDEERITETTALLNALDQYDGDADGYVTIDWRNPDILPLIKDSSAASYDTYSVKFNQNGKCGVDPESLHLYKAYATTATTSYKYNLSFNFKKELTTNESKTSNPTMNIAALGGTGYQDYKFIYKGTIGNTNSGASIKSLPTANMDNRGWIYKALTANYPSGKTIKVGGLFYSDGSTWKILDLPNGKKSENGFYIYTVETKKQLNGPVSESCKCERKGATAAVVAPYFAVWQRLYYTTNSSSTPVKPTVETSTSNATEIVNDNQINKWSTYLSTPDTVTGNTHFFSVWRIKMNSSETSFSEVQTISKDVSNTTITTQISNAKNHFLDPADEISGIPYYDPDTGILSEVRGLFKSDKVGSYYSYGTLTEQITTPISSSNIASVLSKLNEKAQKSEAPLNQKNSYLVVHETTQCTNGNTISSYRLQYYNASSVKDTPTNISALKELIPIFYLKTNSNSVPTPSATNITNTKVNNQWTTILPDKTNSDWIYYSGWKIINYADNITYYASGNADTTLKISKKADTEVENNLVPTYIYATYRFAPDLYYTKIKEIWEQKLYNDNQDLQKYTDKQIHVKGLLKSLQETLTNAIEAKNEEVAKFEHMMGAALRESYWQPEDEYNDYGKKFDEELILHNSDLRNEDGATYWTNLTNQDYASIGWDGILFKEEDKLYFESKVTKEKVYYPCINLLKLIKNKAGSTSAEDVFLIQYEAWAQDANGQNPFSFFFNPSLATIPDADDSQGIRYLKYYTLGVNSKFAFVRAGSEIIPLLVLLDAHNLSDTELTNLYSTGHIGRLIPTPVNKDIVLKYENASAFSINTNDAWVLPSTLENCEIVYPRIVIPSLKLKTNSQDLVIKLGQQVLTEYEDYYTLVKSYYKNNITKKTYTIDNQTVSYRRVHYKDIETITNEELNEQTSFTTLYTITIKPDILFKYIDVKTFNDAKFKIYFSISNADVDIYLDAKKILKENAYPKVAYEIDVSVWQRKLLEKLYNKLAQLVMINDTDLKLEHTFGYISAITLDLDHQENDKVEVKNYKTKFEDLFSKIVAETEEMHKNSHNIGLAGALANGESADVTLTTEGFENTISNPSTQAILQQFLKDYFDGPEVVQEKLKSLFNEAGAILSSAATSLGSVLDLTTENANILRNFRENVAASLTPKVFTGDVAPTIFKPGDIWLNDDFHAVATGYSGIGGFTKVFNGKLAEIAGANVSFDANTGVVDILGETKINLMSGGNVYIAAGDTIDIVGNKAVNIGGTTINMASCNIIGGGYNGSPGEGGIHFVATEYNYDANTEDYEESSISRVDIHGNGIEMASKNGIIIKSGAGIDIKSSDEQDISAVVIDKERGIYIGSNKKLTFFSGDTTDHALIDPNTNQQARDAYGNLLWEATGANVELSSEHLLLGVGSIDQGASNATAIELSKEQIILAAGSQLQYLAKNADGTYNIDKIADPSLELAGVQIKSNYIGMATGRNVLNNDGETWSVNRSIIAMEPGSVKLGQMRLMDSRYANDPTYYDGDFIWLANNEIYIGGMGNFTLNTNNIKIQTKTLENQTGNGTLTSGTPVQMGFALGRYLQGKDANNQNIEPDIGLGFWIDSTGGRHLVVDATDIKLGGNNVAAANTLYGQLPISTAILYKLGSSTTPTAPTGYQWNVKTTALTSSPFETDWKPGLPSPANIDESGDKYVWSITQLTYKSDDKYIYIATTPREEGLAKNLTQTSYKQYKYFSSTLNETQQANALNESTTAGQNWSIAVPDRATTTTYYYGTHACTIGENITTNITLNDSSGSNYTLRKVTATVTVTTARETISCSENDWIIKVQGMWIKTTNIAQKANNYKLYSRIHVIKNTGNTFNKDLQLEDELASLSQAAINAMNIASGALAVPAVASTGLTIDGNNVILGSTGKLMLLGNSEVFIGTSSSNSAMVLNKDGIAIGSGANIALCANGTITMYSTKNDFTNGAPNGFVIGPTGINLSGQALKINILKKNSSNTVLRGFLIDTDQLTSNNTSPVLCMYVGADFANASSGLQFSTKNGLEVKGSLYTPGIQITGNNITATATGVIDFSNAASIALKAGSISMQAIGDYTPPDITNEVNTIVTGLGLTTDGLTISGSKYVKIESGGVLDINTTNVIINSAATGSNAIFRIGGTGTNYKILYSADGTFKVKGDIEASGGSIGGWNIGENYIGNASLLDSSTVGMAVTDTSGGTVFWAGGAYNGTSTSAPQFRVTKEGYVYINSLMVYDPNSQISGTHVGSYAVIDFTQNFSNAVTSTGGSWDSDGNFYATLSIFGKATSKSVRITAGVQVIGGIVNKGTYLFSQYFTTGQIKVNYSINGQIYPVPLEDTIEDAVLIATQPYEHGREDGRNDVINKSTLTVAATYNTGAQYNLSSQLFIDNASSASASATDTFEATEAYNAGYNQAIKDCTVVTRWIINDATTGNVEHYDRNGNSLGAQWYHVTSVDTYSRPQPK